MSSGLNPLNSKWSLYYHDPENPDWSNQSYIKVCDFNSIEMFWKIHSVLPHNLFHLGMFFLMRDDIFPTWEDPQNINGACWSYKIAISETREAWE